MRGHRRLAGSLLVLTLATSLAACSSGDIVVESGAQSSQAQSGVPNLDAERVDAILASVQDTLDAADRSGDAKDLAGRVTGPAAEMRAAQYRLAEATGASVPPLELQASTVTVTNSRTWPRAIVDFTRASDGGLPAVFVLVQDTPRSDYRLRSWSRLLGGTSLTTMSGKDGSPYLGADATGFAMTPGDAVGAYVDMLNAGNAGDDSFTTDEFATTSLAEVKSLTDSVKAAGKVTAKAATGDFPVSGVLLEDGSALVSGTFTVTHTYARTVKDSKMKLGGTAAALNSGDDSVVGTLSVTYLVNVLIEVPTTGKATLVGAERAIQSTSRDDSKKPRGE